MGARKARRRGTQPAGANVLPDGERESSGLGSNGQQQGTEWGGVEPDDACLDVLIKGQGLVRVSEGATWRARESTNAAQESETAADAADCSRNAPRVLNYLQGSKTAGPAVNGALWWMISRVASQWRQDRTRHMDKFSLQQQVLARLAEDLQQTEQAARVAHETATHEENIAENKYDTLGLEAAYLATGQARRAQAIREAMAAWRQFRPPSVETSTRLIFPLPDQARPVML